MSIIFFLKPIYRDIGGRTVEGYGKSKKKRKKKKELLELLPKPVTDLFAGARKRFLDALLEQELRALLIKEQILSEQEFQKQTMEMLTVLDLLDEL